jgi:hypothetical protein
MRKSEVLLTLAFIGSASASFWLWNELKTERARNAELDASIAAHRADAVAVTEPAAPAQQATPLPLPVLAPVPVLTEAATARPSNVVQGTEQEWMAYQRRLMQDPKYREAWRQQERLKYSPRRENLIRLLGLSPEQADAVIDVSVDRSLAWVEHPRGEESREQMKTREDAEDREDQAKLGALLGESKRVQLQAYMESRGTRMQVDRFRTQMTGADAIRDDQVEPLIAALHVEQAQMRKDLEEYRDSLDWQADPKATSREFGERQIEQLKATHRRMHASAATILSGSQLDRLDALLKNELERREAEARMSRVQAKLD